MLLSIITINYNNAEGLRKTLASVASQTYAEIEHIIIDGGSTDESVEILEAYPQPLPKRRGEITEGKFPTQNPAHKVIWVSEKDNGIYNAMNKGIRMATGEYCQFLNSGDMLAADDVTTRMMNALKEHQCIVECVKCKGKEDIATDQQAACLSPIAHNLQSMPTIFYGNMKKLLPNGKTLHDACNGGNDITLDMFYRGCLNHSPAYIKRSLFDKYGMYDENLRICSDWKFYMQSIVLGGEKVQYVDIDMTLFDMTGISETNKDLLNNERNQLLKEMVPVGILRDYDNYHFAVDQYKRLKKHHLWGFVYFIERVLFKLEKWHILR